MRSRERGVTAVLLLALVGAAGAKPAAREAPPTGGFFDLGAPGSRKEPITITSDTLEYDHKASIAVYRGSVVAVQGDTKVNSDTLTVTFEGKPAASGTTPPSTPPSTAGFDPPSTGSRKVHEIVAVGNVRIDQGARWATGGRAVFEQADRTLVLTESPVLHEGQSEVAGDRVVVYIDQDKSIVEGGRKRVKAVIYPSGKDTAAAPGAAVADVPSGTPAP